MAEISFRRCKLVVDAIEIGEAKTPVEMVRLHGVRLALDIEDLLIGQARVRDLRVSLREICVS